MAHRTPATISAEAAEAVRELNHATLGRADGWRYPADAYSTVAGLSRMAMGLEQALDQIGALVEHLDMGGHLRSDKDTLVDDLENTYGGLADATDAARKLYAALNRAHSGLSPIAYKD